MISICQPPSQDNEFFLNSLTVILDHFTKVYENYLIMADFNLEPHDKRSRYFLNSNNLVNLVKDNTCFKGSRLCTDLILTNRKYSFKNITLNETVLRITTTWFLILLFNRKNPSFSFIEIMKTLSLNISKMIFRKPYRAARAHMMHLTTISPPALINMLLKRERFFREMKSLI